MKIENINQEPTTTPNAYLELQASLDIECDLSVELSGGTPTPVEPVLIDKKITENGLYNASDDDADGYSSVDVSVAEPVLIEKSVTDNGVYLASDDEADGYSKVSVEVPIVVPTLIDKSISDNGTYHAVDDEADGYANVTVNVQPDVMEKNITNNGTYLASSDNVDGYSKVTVDVPIETFEDAIKRSADRIALIRNVTVSDWSWHIYSLASGNYFLGLMTVPFVIRCRTKFTRALGSTTVTSKLAQFGYVANSVINTGRILSVGGFLDAGNNTLMFNGIPSNLLIDSTDFPNVYTDVSITESSASYASNNSPLLFRESQVYNLDETNSHPLAVKMFGNNRSAIIADYIAGNGNFTMFDVCTVGDSDVPQGFNLADMTQAYLLYTSNDNFILIIADSNWGGLYVDANGKLNANSGNTVYCSPSWNTSPSQYNNLIRNLPIAARTNKPPFAEGSYDNYPYHIIYNTEDIFDTDNNLIVEKNISIENFKNNLFHVS